MDKKMGFIGLGAMGRPMAANILKAGFDLTVYDIRSEPMQELEKLGAKVTRSPQEVGEQCDIIETIVVNDAQVEEVILGKDGSGVLAGARPGSIIVIHSTVSPKTCQHIAALAKDKGVGVIDAPVSGAESGAQAGTLSIMVGGEAELLETCRPVLNVLGKTIFHLGAVGMGEMAKIVNNLMVIVNQQSTREGLRLARMAGIERKRCSKSFLLARAIVGQPRIGRCYGSWRWITRVVPRAWPRSAIRILLWLSRPVTTSARPCRSRPWLHS